MCVFSVTEVIAFLQTYNIDLVKREKLFLQNSQKKKITWRNVLDEFIVKLLVLDCGNVLLENKNGEVMLGFNEKR